MPAGAVTVSGGASAPTALGGRGAPCATIDPRSDGEPGGTGTFIDDGRFFYVGSIGHGRADLRWSATRRTGRLRPVSGGSGLHRLPAGLRPDRPSDADATSSVTARRAASCYAGGASAERGSAEPSRRDAADRRAHADRLPRQRPRRAAAGTRRRGRRGARASRSRRMTALVDRHVGRGASGSSQRDPATGALSQAPDACMRGRQLPGLPGQVPARTRRSAACPASTSARTAARLYVAADGRPGTSLPAGLSVFTRRPRDGRADARAALRTNADPPATCELAVAPDGRNVYAVTRGVGGVRVHARPGRPDALTRIPGKARLRRAWTRAAPGSRASIDARGRPHPRRRARTSTSRRAERRERAAARPPTAGCASSRAARRACEMVRGGELKPVIAASVSAASAATRAGQRHRARARAGRPPRLRARDRTPTAATASGSCR